MTEEEKKTVTQKKHPGRVAHGRKLAALMKKRKEKILHNKEQYTVQSTEHSAELSSVQSTAQSTEQSSVQSNEEVYNIYFWDSLFISNFSIYKKDTCKLKHFLPIYSKYLYDPDSY